MAKDNRLLNSDRPLSVEEAYALRPRLWWLYTLIVLIIVGWLIIRKIIKIDV